MHLRLLAMIQAVLLWYLKVSKAFAKLHSTTLVLTSPTTRQYALRRGLGIRFEFDTPAFCMGCGCTYSNPSL
jgi:hypothetical protein